MAQKQIKKAGFTTMKCRLCSANVPKVDINAKSVICWKCTHLGVEGYLESDIKYLSEHERNKIFVK